MAGVTRRGFIKTSGVAAAGIATAGVAGGALAAALGSAAPGSAANAERHMVAYIRAGSNGEVTVMEGDRQVSYNDPQMVRRMQKALA